MRTEERTGGKTSYKYEICVYVLLHGILDIKFIPLCYFSLLRKVYMNLDTENRRLV